MDNPLTVCHRALLEGAFNASGNHPNWKGLICALPYLAEVALLTWCVVTFVIGVRAQLDAIRDWLGVSATVSTVPDAEDPSGEAEVHQLPDGSYVRREVTKRWVPVAETDSPRIRR